MTARELLRAAADQLSSHGLGMDEIHATALRVIADRLDAEMEYARGGVVLSADGTSVTGVVRPALIMCLARLDASPIALPEPDVRRASVQNHERGEQCDYPGCYCKTADGQKAQAEARARLGVAPPGEPTAPVQTWATDLAGMPVDSVPPTAVDPEVPRCPAYCGEKRHIDHKDSRMWWKIGRAYCSELCSIAGAALHPAQPGGSR